MSPPRLHLRNVSRRALLHRLGAGAFVLGGFLRPGRSYADKSVVAPEIDREVFNPLAFVTLEPSGIVRVVAHRVEMGQGVRSTLTTILADEMGAEIGRVHV